VSIYSRGGDILLSIIELGRGGKRWRGGGGIGRESFRVLKHSNVASQRKK
jgi:hypothetical protein